MSYAPYMYNLDVIYAIDKATQAIEHVLVIPKEIPANMYYLDLSTETGYTKYQHIVNNSKISIIQPAMWESYVVENSRGTHTKELTDLYKAICIWSSDETATIYALKSVTTFTAKIRIPILTH